MQRTIFRAGLGVCVASVAICSATIAAAHGFAGPRFFPATVATEDPFTADELALPTVAWFKDGDEVRTTSYSMEFAKRITPNFALAFGGTYLRLDPKGESAVYGFENIDIGAKYQIAVNRTRETIYSIGVEAALGGTGTNHIGAEDFTVVTPAFFFGKGFGDLFEPMSFMRAFAVTGLLGVAIPTEAHTTNEFGEIEDNPSTLEIGLALEYSMIYLQSQVQNIGLGPPFDRMVLLTEISLETPMSGDGSTRGTISPGFVWTGEVLQISAQAIIPWNRESGRAVGFLTQLHFYLDDIFPATLGRPIFGE